MTALIQRHILLSVERIKNARAAGLPELERMHKAALFALLAVKRELRATRVADPDIQFWADRQRDGCRDRIARRAA